MLAKNTNKILIAPSILSADFAKMGEEVLNKFVQELSEHVPHQKSRRVDLNRRKAVHRQHPVRL